MKRRVAQRVRIIGGQWRGRKLDFPDLPGIRPTPDRVRETLFNWLQPVIVGARCLDLFAGSGALGLEALSRGAAQVTFVEKEPRAVAQLNETLAALGADSGTVVRNDAAAYLNRACQPYDIVFLDPPFRAGLLLPCCVQLEQQGWLATDARIYIETEAEAGDPIMPEPWHISRHKRSGQVAYLLAMRNA
ncbi:MAG: 16S rRNA (guanine(966)-N(2))-methyltransferase RsmD [Gammaproteobacteria bacterium]|nr:16S rRNA (guanine(966)-N(2))-methyltransferase RsmD [Gammaproteobacteria bacterium]